MFVKVLNTSNTVITGFDTSTVRDVDDGATQFAGLDTPTITEAGTYSHDDFLQFRRDPQSLIESFTNSGVDRVVIPKLQSTQIETVSLSEGGILPRNATASHVTLTASRPSGSGLTQSTAPVFSVTLQNVAGSEEPVYGKATLATDGSFSSFDTQANSDLSSMTLGQSASTITVDSGKLSEFYDGSDEIYDKIVFLNSSGDQVEYDLDFTSGLVFDIMNGTDNIPGADLPRNSSGELEFTFKKSSDGSYKWASFLKRISAISATTKGTWTIADEGDGLLGYSFTFDSAIADDVEEDPVAVLSQSYQLSAVTVSAAGHGASGTPTLTLKQLGSTDKATATFTTSNTEMSGIVQPANTDIKIPKTLLVNYLAGDDPKNSLVTFSDLGNSITIKELA